MQYSQSVQRLHKLQSLQFLQLLQFTQPEQFEHTSHRSQSWQSTQFIQFVQFVQFFKFCNASSAPSYEPKYSNEHLLPFASVTHRLTVAIVFGFSGFKVVVCAFQASIAAIAASHPASKALCTSFREISPSAKGFGAEYFIQALPQLRGIV
jgi:hypothetical protein